jgi:hypothetical protein
MIKYLFSFIVFLLLLIYFSIKIKNVSLFFLPEDSCYRGNDGVWGDSSDESVPQLQISRVEILPPTF